MSGHQIVDGMRKRGYPSLTAHQISASLVPMETGRRSWGPDFVPEGESPSGAYQ